MRSDLLVDHLVCVCPQVGDIRDRDVCGGHLYQLRATLLRACRGGVARVRGAAAAGAILVYARYACCRVLATSSSVPSHM